MPAGGCLVFLLSTRRGKDPNYNGASVPLMKCVLYLSQEHLNTFENESHTYKYILGTHGNGVSEMSPCSQRSEARSLGITTVWQTDDRQEDTGPSQPSRNLLSSGDLPNLKSKVSDKVESETQTQAQQGMANDKRLQRRSDRTIWPFLCEGYRCPCACP